MSFAHKYPLPIEIHLSKQTEMYAHDAYFLDCAIRYKAPLLTLDKKLKTSAQNLNVETMEF